MQDLPQHGSLSEIYLPRLIAALHRAGFEGTVRVGLAETTKVVYFRHGDIASAASNAESDRLANILIRDDRLTPAQLDLAKSRVVEGGSLGKTLIELGFLSPTELLQGARRQVREILATCFTLRHGRFDVEPGSLPPEVTSLGLPTRRLIFDSVLQASERDTVLREVGSMETVYKPDGDLGPALDVLRLDPEMDRVARSLDGSSSLRDLSGRTSLDDFSVSRIVLALEVLGLAERIGAPLPEPGPLPDEETAAMDAAIEDGPLLSPEEEAAIPILGIDEAAAPVPIQPPAWGVVPPEDAVEPPVVEIEVAPPAAPAPVVVRDRSRRIDVTPEPPPAPEPPPIPAEELPAFATAPDEAPEGPATDALATGTVPEATESWQIDPESGDRVRLGPVEMTFDGEIAPPERRSWMRPRVLTTASATLVAIALVAAFLALRRGGEAADAAPAPPPEPRAQATTPTPQPPAQVTKPVPQPRSQAAVPEPRPTEPVAVPEAPPARQAAAPTPAPEGPAAIPTPPPADQGEAPAPSPAPVEVVADEAPRGSTSPFRDGGRYLRTLEILDAGDVAGAALAFQELAAAEPASRLTLQLMVACVEETVRNARTRSGEGGSLFFVPYSLKGRACYRVCWGVYESRDAAREAAARVPEAIRPSGSSPVPVPLAALATSH